jgi:predicted SAM-dependent methyltransferase
MREDQRVIEFRDEVLAARQPPPPPISGGAVVRAVPAWVPGFFRRWSTLAMKPVSRRRWADVADSKSIRLHVGCGWTYLEDWVNVDLFATKADIAWDLRQGIPLSDDSVDAIFHEHMLEHLSLHDGLLFTRECARVLKPSGILRIGVPDAGECIDSYSGKADPGWASSRPTGMLAVQALFYENGHRAMYDGETLTLMCRAAGFGEAQRQQAGETWLDVCPDTPDRASGTLYVDARKAGSWI